MAGYEVWDGVSERTIWVCALEYICSRLIIRLMDEDYLRCDGRDDWPEMEANGGVRLEHVGGQSGMALRGATGYGMGGPLGWSGEAEEATGLGPAP